MRQNIQVPFGYEPPVPKRKGTLIYYDTFENTSEANLERAVSILEERSFGTLVLYPLHEETVRRMSKEPVRSFYKREDELHDWRRARQHADITVEGWEGKRKKYTPIDAALRFLAEKYPAPYFLLITPETANLFASFSSFEEWIKSIRLILTEQPSVIHPRLQKYAHRWETAEGHAGLEES